MPAATQSRLGGGRPPSRRRSPAAAIAARRRRSAHARRRRRQVVLWLIVAVVVAAVTFAAGLVAAPLNYNFEPVPPKSVLLLDSTGQPFASIRSPQIEEPVTGAQIPTVMRQAIVAAEDERFYSNPGVDPLAIARAAWSDISGHHLEGGSTITQQYVKNVYTGAERTGLRKLREASLAIRLEQHLTKDEILTRYLNTLYLGNGTAGVQAASKFYYGVPITKLSYNLQTKQNDPTLGLARAATLAGIAPAPSDWNPVDDPAQARVRERYVLNRMIVAGDISTEQAGAAYGGSLPAIAADAAPDAPTVAPEFRDLVSQQIEKYGDTALFTSGGVQVKTTLDLDMQEAAIQALHQVLPKYKGLDAAVVAVDPRNGDLRAITERKAGGYVANGLDVAAPPENSTNRSSGSTIKPFTLAAALEHGHTLTEGHYAPQCIQVAPGYKPCNAEGGAGYYSLQSALVQSINTVYAPLGVQVGLHRVVKLAKAAGLQVGHLDSGKTCGVKKHEICPSYALGIPVSPLSEADAYGTLVNHGVHQPVRSVMSVKSADNGTLFTAAAKPAGTRVMPAKIADQVASAMEQVVSEGTGRAAQQTFPVYGKTGTTDDFTNAWFTGCTHTLCITVWMGYDRPYVKSGGKIVAHELKSTGGAPVYGGTIPAEIFAKMYSNLRFLQSPTKYPMPSATPTAPYVPQKTASATPTATASAKSTKKPGKGSTSSPKPTKQPTKAPSKKPTTPASTGPTKKASTAPTAG